MCEESEWDSFNFFIFFNGSSTPLQRLSPSTASSCLPKKYVANPSSGPGISYYGRGLSLLSVHACTAQEFQTKQKRRTAQRKINKTGYWVLQKVVFSCVILWWRTRKRREIACRMDGILITFFLGKENSSRVEHFLRLLRTGWFLGKVNLMCCVGWIGSAYSRWLTERRSAFV